MVASKRTTESFLELNQEIGVVLVKLFILGKIDIDEFTSKIIGIFDIVSTYGVSMVNKCSCVVYDGCCLNARNVVRIILFIG